MISDPDLEAKTRFSPRSVVDDSFLGAGVALWRGGGEGVEGWWRGLHPVPSHLPFQGKGLRTLVFTGQSLGPGSPLMIPLVPGPACPVPASCRCPSRCNRQGPILKSPSESDTGTLVILWTRDFRAHSEMVSNKFWILSRVVDPDPDPYWIRIQSDHWIWIRICNLNMDPDPDPGGQK